MATIIPLYDVGPNCTTSTGTNGSTNSCLTYSAQLYLEVVKSEELEFYEFFKKATRGLSPWGAQKSWLKRLLRDENTTLIAPTGTGKTTLLIVYALYAAKKGRRVLYVAPTKPLQEQVYNKLMEYAKAAGLESLVIIRYSSSLSKKTRGSILGKIACCDFHMLVVTSGFLRKRYPELLKCSLDVVVVDDVDSFLKNEKNIYVMLNLLGYSNDIIELAKRYVNLQWKILVEKAMGKNIEHLIREYISLDSELNSKLATTKTGQLIVASATGRTRGLAGKVLKNLLRVDISGISIYGRDVTDCYFSFEKWEDLVSHVVSLIRKLGRGCIVYIAPFHPYKEQFTLIAGRIAEALNKAGLAVAEANAYSVAEFVSGNIDVLVGSASYYGLSVRGIDSPRHIRYVVFLGTPLHKVPLESLLASVNMLVRALLELYAVTSNQEYRQLALKVRRKTLVLTPGEKRIIKLYLSGKLSFDLSMLTPKLQATIEELKDAYNKAVQAIKNILNSRGVVSMGSITLIKQQDGNYYALIPDVMTYIQASGRTSRLIGNTMTHGLSIIIEHCSLLNTVKSLEAKLRWFNKDLGFKKLEDISLDEEAVLIDKSRSGTHIEKLKYKSILLVVESPIKAKTIAKFFGKPISRKIGDVKVFTIPAKIGDEVVEFNIIATRGHMFELTTKPIGLYGVLVDSNRVSPIYTTIKKCKLCGTQFTDYENCPRCGSTAYMDSKTTIMVLEKLASEVDEVYIATDPDIEGEKIAYDIYTSINHVNSNIWRIELHEITPGELIKALKSPRSINLKLVEAEMYRRVLDRLVGFSLSTRLQQVFAKKSLGAGRVQTPVLGLIIERYGEYLKYKCKKVVVEVSEPINLKFSVCFDKSQEDLLKMLANTRELLFVKAAETLEEYAPKPPYTTSELLADTSRIGFTAGEAMAIAQELFEAGLITYHRTDCTYISQAGISIAREYLAQKSLLDLFKPSHWGEPGTHEAIRPVYPVDAEDLLKAIEEGLIDVVVPITPSHLKLYDLIFRRFIASQMKPFKAVKAVYSIVISGLELTRVELIVDIVETGFNAVVPVKVYSHLKNLDRFTAVVSGTKLLTTSRVPLYSEGDVVVVMKKLGLGRPSTYAKIIENIKRHGYVIESKNFKKLVPTKKGILVYEYLQKNYPECTSVELTKRMEDTVDQIALGKITGYEATMELLWLLGKAGLLPLNLDSNVGLYTPSTTSTTY